MCARVSLLLVAGEHFNYCEDRETPMPFDPAHTSYPGLQPLVDDLIAKGQRDTAIKYLTLKGCHGQLVRTCLFIVAVVIRLYSVSILGH